MLFCMQNLALDENLLLNQSERHIDDRPLAGFYSYVLAYV